MRSLAAAALVTLAFAAAACTSSASGSRSSAPPTSSRATSTSAATRASTPPAGSAAPRTSSAPRSPAQRALAGLNLRGRAGQLIMIDCPSGAVGDATTHALREDRVGSVILDGNSSSGVSGIAQVTARLQDLAPRAIGLFIATDQEGGQVQRLRGPGFDPIASAVTQGGTSPDALRRQTARWGRQLRSAGVNVDLAPVLDTVPAGGGSNPPIGDLDREYGHTPAAVSSHGVAVVRGLLDAGVDPTVKHFPGLGRVAGNTDTTSGVTDTVTGGRSSYLQPFRDAVQAGTPFVMMSTAVYARLDPGTPAAFSRPIVSGLLRGTLGFRGVVVSDDVGHAKQVAAYSPGERAVRFVSAGGDLVLTVVATQADAMVSALVARAKADPDFRKLVDAAALRVLQAKQARGLL